jgi:hypothetical protein
MSALTSSVHSRRSLPALGLLVSALVGSLVLMALVAAPTWAVPGVTTSTNPASSALGPVSKQAQPGAGATGVGSATRSSSGAVGGAGAPGGVGGTGAGTAPGSGTPTTTYKPPATSPTGAGATGIQTRPAATSVTGNHAPRRASSSTSTAAIVLAILALLLALGAAAWGIARWQAYEPRWTVSMRHAMAEAGFRASSTWAEFTDWVRLGR